MVSDDYSIRDNLDTGLPRVRNHWVCDHIGVLGGLIWTPDLLSAFVTLECGMPSRIAILSLGMPSST